MKRLQPAVWLFNKLHQLTACICAASVCEKCAQCHSDVRSPKQIAAYGFQLRCGALGRTTN